MSFQSKKLPNTGGWTEFACFQADCRPHQISQEKQAQTGRTDPNLFTKCSLDQTKTSKIPKYGPVDLNVPPVSIFFSPFSLKICPSGF